MHAVNLISSAVRGKGDFDIPVDISYGVCAVTGQYGPCLPRGYVIPSSNCDQPWFAAPQSNLVGVDVWIAWNYGYLKDGSKRKTRFERQSCWWCDGREFKQIKRLDIRRLVLDGSPSSPWSMWVTTSYKKHGSIRAPVNIGRRGVVAFEERIVDVSDEGRVHRWWNTLLCIRKRGVSRFNIELLECPRLDVIGIGEWIDFDRWARPRYKSALYALLCYLLPSNEEIKKEGFESQ